MSNSTAKLPPFANVKWGMIFDANLQTHDAVQGTRRRIRELEDQVGMLEGAEEAGGIEMEIGRLRGVMSGLQNRLNAHAAVLGSLRLYREKMANVELEDAPRITPRLKGNETLADAVKRIRDEIAKLAAERAKVTHAFLPMAELKAQASAYVNNLAKTVRVRIKTEPTFEAFLESDSGGFSIARWLAWIAPDVLKERLYEELESQIPDDALILTGPERKTRLSEIKTRLDRLNREEEALIMRAQESGLEILRRADADPAAVLGVRRKAAKAAAA